MRNQFNAICDDCRTFKPGCVRVHRRILSSRVLFDTEKRTTVLCPDCRVSLRWQSKYRLADEHRARTRR